MAPFTSIRMIFTTRIGRPVELDLPPDLPFGAYALHVWCGDSDVHATREGYISFFVPPPKAALQRGLRPKLCFLAPTCSYIAYANHAGHFTGRDVEILRNRAVHFGHSDLWLYAHPELGGSLYDVHADGSGVAYSSRLRPVVNFKAQYHSWLGGHGSAVYHARYNRRAILAYEATEGGAGVLKRAEDSRPPRPTAKSRDPYRGCR